MISLMTLTLTYVLKDRVIINLLYLKIYYLLFINLLCFIYFKCIYFCCYEWSIRSFARCLLK